MKKKIKLTAMICFYTSIIQTKQSEFVVPNAQDFLANRMYYSSRMPNLYENALPLNTGNYINNQSSQKNSFTIINQPNNYIPDSLNKPIKTSYADPKKILYTNLIIKTNYDELRKQISQEQYNLDNLKAEIHNQIMMHANELELIEKQIKSAQNSLKESKVKGEKKILKNRLEFLKKQKKLTLYILSKVKKQETSIIKRQKELYKDINFYKKYINEDKTIKIKSNQKIHKKDLALILEIIKNNQNIMILVKPSTKQHDLLDQLGTIIDAEQIKPHNYIEKAKYITDQKNINIAKQTLKQEENFKKEVFKNEKKRLNEKLKQFGIFHSKDIVKEYKNAKKTLKAELKIIEKEKKEFKKREIELKKFGNFHYKYTISFNGSLPSEIRVNEKLNEIMLSDLSKIFSKYNNLNLLIKPNKN